MNFLKKLVLLLSIITFGLVLWQVKPPQSFTSATFTQILLLFIPLILLLTFLFHLYFHFYLKSLLTSLGIVLLLMLKGLDVLNSISFILGLLGLIALLKLSKRINLAPTTRSRRHPQAAEKQKHTNYWSPRQNLNTPLKRDPKQNESQPEIPKLKRIER